MAEALVSVLLERLATLSIEKIQRELNRVIGVKEEVKKLTKKLEAIRAVLEDAEQRQEMDASIKLWLNELNEVSYDMDDVLDEWITRVLKHQLEKKVCFPSPSSCFPFGQVKRVFLHRKFAVKIKDLDERLSVIDENKQSFGFQTTTRVHELPQRQTTTSLPNEKTFGRDDEKNLLVSKLLSESSAGKEVPLIIPIVGMGGMGKTSLANFVYNDEKVKSHFDEKIWVCVSDPFEEINICKAIIERLGRENGSNELETLMNIINESIRGKKFLLVLDDVWSPELRQWEELIKPLSNSVLGSKILVTTRKVEVATLMKATSQMIRLGGLDEEYCLSLFYYSADINESSLSNELQHIGLEIVKKCNGLPLAAKTLGSLMRNKKKNTHEWQAVLNSKTWELKEIQQDVFRPLLLSFHDLSPITKRCLLYCVTFPKDYVFEKNNLIELWMAQDYLGAKGSKEKITLGENHFDDLIMRSFFQDIKEEDGEIACKIHDIVHDFLQYLIKNECLILDFELDASERMEAPTDKVHHLTIVHASESESLRHFLRNNKKIRSLTTIDSSNNFLRYICKSIIHLKSLRTLNLSGRSLRGSIETIPEGIGGLVHLRYIETIPEGIGGLVHLRYIDLSYHSKLRELPDTFGGLYNLQTLRLDGCTNLRELPDTFGGLYNLQTLRLGGCSALQKLDVTSLIHLNHLYVWGCDELKVIKGIEKLTDLQRLDLFIVEEDGVSGNKLEDLKDLNQLQGTLVIEVRGNPNLVEKAILVNKAHLSRLTLSLIGGGEDTEIMNDLEPHPRLDSLQIWNYSGRAFSPWLLSLNYLTHLSLAICMNCGVLPPLGKLASLESLGIVHLDGVKKVGVEFLGIDGQTSSSSSFLSFPKLKELTILYMYSWEEWEGVEDSENITIMPCLSILDISYCSKIKALPDFLWKIEALQTLDIYRSPLLGKLYTRTGEDSAKTCRIKTIWVNDEYGRGICE